MISFAVTRNMPQNVVLKLLSNAETAEKRLLDLRSKLNDIKKVKIEYKIKELVQENKVLAIKVEKAKAELIKLEILNGKKQYPIPGKTSVPCSINNEASFIIENQDKVQVIAKKENNVKETKKCKEKSSLNIESVVDVRKLDFRVGKIIEVNKHPDADSLYVEKIECGEEKPRTVVSGLVHHVPINEMKDRMVMILCNLKPVKMRGVTSEGMVMCASSPEKVEVLVPPSEAVPGDVVMCEGYPREPESQLNPKKKIFETCAPDLKTNEERIACYKGSPLIVPDKGPVIAPTLKGVSVK